MRHDEDRLRDIIEAIDAIQRRVPSTAREAFDADERVRVWCLHHLTIVGEATARLSQEFRDRHPS